MNINYISLKFLSLAIFCSLNSFAQQYAKYIEQGKVWNAGNYSYKYSSSCNKYAGTVYYVADDTLINSISYTKIKQFPVVRLSSSPSCVYENQQQNTSVFAYVREDTILHKVYNIENIDGKWIEGLFLDFNLKKGDKIAFKNRNANFAYTPFPKLKGDTSSYRTVDTVIVSTNSLGKISRKIKFNVSAYSMNGYWLEGEGGEGDPSGNLYEQHTEFSVYMSQSTRNNKVINGNLMLSIDSEKIENSDEFIPENFNNIEVYNSLGSKLISINSKEEVWPEINKHKGELIILHINTGFTMLTKKIVISK